MAFFTDSSLFDGLKGAESQALRQLGKSRQILANDYLFLQHSTAHSLYTVEQGVMMVERTAANGRRQVMAFVFPGISLALPIMNILNTVLKH
ncbi:Crp/Fnr family transcriptional regulator [Oceanicoccus sp. KOV_DT_Chl]|uniref:Crp/Fnr family transcriptional regulator n=1 Tax=Oceanicoccus sp. KOV_DT_Chl TaxID=1904639 RepID=UPI000C799BDE|nr:Crp/Fnr family transcriptional regulator [Oceanicoccus sp. KOV_DT_Chl]